MLRIAGALAFGVMISGQTLAAQDVRITPDLARQSLTINGAPLVIERIQDPEHRLTGDFTKTSRACPPFCITPMQAAPGVATLGELEVLEFLDTRVAADLGLLLDSRVPEWFAKGSIPGAVNVPFTTLDAANPYRDDILQALGAVKGADGLDFTAARDLLVFCNGPWCDQAPRAIRSLLSAGYPPGKLSFYRGGMQLWLQLGLTVAMPQ
ncbi:MAG: rhodanese-like domain-containing protein [Rhodobacteraceae bacterium]|nr:MAG: rhodanese-like domain-containing protein [Paracoccaceae bacterium]